MKTQTLYQEAIKFATDKHEKKKQKVPGTDLPYVVHLSNVTMEILIAASHSDQFDLEFAVPVALLHDTLEDTSTTFAELEEQFGIEVATGVAALTKNEELPKEEQMQDSIRRVKNLRSEVWAIKLADRITNLQPPPSKWNKERKTKYQEESRTILSALKDGNAYLANRLKEKIEEYNRYIHT